MAKFDLPIPQALQELRRDEKGYPIPFFVAKKDGKYDFRLLDARKQKLAAEDRLCGICGKKLPKDYFYFISGPIGMTNRVSSDPPMHRLCAEFALEACPHLKYRRAQRRETGLDLNAVQNVLLLVDKPDDMYLVKVSKCKFVVQHGQPVFTYTYVSHEKYSYNEDGELQKVGN